MSSPPIVGGYSFYLNVVVIDSGPGGAPRDDPEPESKEIPVERTIDFENTDDSASIPVIEEVDKKDQAIVSAPDTTSKLLLDGRSFVDSISSSITKRAAAFVAEEKQKKTPDPKKLAQDGQRFMKVIGSSISKTSSNISNRATAFVASKTMVSRAEKAVVECIPMVTEEIGVEMSISKRFQQGPVFVLEVDMKGCDLLELLKKVLGEDAAKHYQEVRQGLDFLGMADSMKAFDQEILPKVRKGMMAKMSEIVPEKMKLKKGNADLEIQCVALEDAEEAKWLYNFLEFMEQMK
mmetsp:Transcript_14440/g.23883  ORF Transcript_14440/g.23883 Transcript_14440/m.23883 type:complete len:292 (-) Transcript_14440:85-960(-)|eukprot:CAMPEP_0119017092 /NCGR_PEP_ID=MMETSP1176-20130426/15298_1 /TAXON_ID=265551 /ORGANISM="Synedropsis recta cf, Strain CCMP1620" /LENGTH=291 /DNA_ID=CAMNT_0006970695 /DNA_START=45 /DNA_END=920 /DNA_ORIENTATION=-